MDFSLIMAAYVGHKLVRLPKEQRRSMAKMMHHFATLDRDDA